MLSVATKLQRLAHCAFILLTLGYFIPEQFTVKAHPALFEGEEEGGGGRGEAKKSEEHFYSSLHSHSHSKPQTKL